MTARRSYPTPEERSEAEQNELRDRILTAAEAILVEEGPDKLSVRGIARRISYAPASLYYHFPDKEAIVAGILARGGQRIGEAIAHAMEAAADPLDGVRRAFRAYVEVSLERPALARLVYLAKRPGATNLREGASGRNPNLVRLALLIREAQATGTVGEGDVDLIVRSIWTAAQGLVIRLVLDEVEAGEERDRLIAGYLNLVLNGLQRRD
ncbi:MAG TPA: TetR/AcrR family transcriptional regulator [Spirochaetia bacterium]|nr:TetR/AcrR family transcriptional regulator [Spirochaetia bacterium]